jgi:hypothetical protein
MRFAGLTLLIAIVLAPVSAALAGQCPTVANDHDDIARCMVPLKGTIGTASVYSSGRYDEDHQELMAAMRRTTAVPPQVMPGPLATVYPFFAMYPYLYNRTGVNPAFWLMVRYNYRVY